jgi:DNA-binding NarL/FixJ family response regulator
MPVTASYNIAIIDQHPLVRFAVSRVILDKKSAITVVFDDCHLREKNLPELVKAAPDCLVLDPADYQDGAWLPIIQELLALLPNLDVIFLASQLSVPHTVLALENGVRAIVGKTSCVSDLALAIAAVREGKYWVEGTGVVRNLFMHTKTLRYLHRNTQVHGLTPRELEVTSSIVDGCTNRDIGKQFSISEETVKRHLSNIFDKTGVSTRLELAIYAIAHKIISTPKAQPLSAAA